MQPRYEWTRCGTMKNEADIDKRKHITAHRAMRAWNKNALPGTDVLVIEHCPTRRCHAFSSPSGAACPRHVDWHRRLTGRHRPTRGPQDGASRSAHSLREPRLDDTRSFQFSPAGRRCTCTRFLALFSCLDVHAKRACTGREE